MLTNGRASYHPVLTIPAHRIGRWAVEHVTYPAGHEFRLASPRTMLYGGHAGGVVSYPHDTTWHRLVESGSVWMTDYPIEQRQHDALFDGMRGRVLVGGLGLGYAATALARRRAVRQIVVVERARAVADLVWPHLEPRVRRKATLVVGDLFRYLRRNESWFDHGFYDIWSGDGEATFHAFVVPLRRLSASRVGDVRCWNEDVMRGQLVQGLETRIHSLHFDFMRPDGVSSSEMLDRFVTATNPYWKWSVPFWRWHARVQPTRDDALRFARTYAMAYGTPNERAIKDFMAATGAVAKTKQRKEASDGRIGHLHR